MTRLLSVWEATRRWAVLVFRRPFCVRAVLVLVLASRAAHAQSNTQQLSWVGSVAVDDAAEVVTASWSLEPVGDNAVVTLAELELAWRKTLGSCAAPVDGDGRVAEMGLTLQTPWGSVPLVDVGQYPQAAGPSLQRTVFAWQPTPMRTVLGSGPVQPVSGPLEQSLWDTPARGLWRVLATDVAEGAPLCVVDAQLTVSSTQPPVARIAELAAAVEGLGVQLDASLSSDDDGISHVGWVCEGGELDADTCVWPDQTVASVTLTVTDTAGIERSATQAVTVRNAPPAIQRFDVQSSGAPDAVLVDIEVQDVADDVVSVTVDVGDGSPVRDLGRVAAFEHGYDAPGTYELTLTAEDEDGGRTRQTQRITVDNTAPDIALLRSFDADEGQPVRLEAQAVDGSASALTYSWQLGDGSPILRGVDLTHVEHTYAQDGEYAVTLTVSDELGGSSQQSITVRVFNLPPVILGILGPSEVVADVEFLYRAQVMDPGADPVTLEWTTTDPEALERTLAEGVAVIWRSPGSQQVTVVASDAQGATSSASRTVDVQTRPTIVSRISGIPPLVYERDLLRLVAQPADPTATWEWFLDGAEVVEAQQGRTLGVRWDAPGVKTVRVVATGETGQTAALSVDIPVTNLLPSLLNAVPLFLAQGQPLRWQPEVMNPADDVLSYALSQAPAGATVAPLTGVVQWPVGAQVLGSSAFVLAIDDGEGGVTSVPWTLSVVADVDQDGLGDAWELEHGLNPGVPNDTSADVDGDGRSWLQEFGDGTDPAVDDRSVLQGAPRWELGEQPALAWSVTASERSRIRDYTVEVYADPSLTQRLHRADGLRDTRAVIPTERLVEDTTLYARVRANNRFGPGPWSSAPPRLYSQLDACPSAPSLIRPVAGGYLTPSSPLQWTASADPEGAVVRYRVVLRDAATGALLASHTRSGSTAWIPSPAGLLARGQTLTWSVEPADAPQEAIDAGTARRCPPSATQSFTWLNAEDVAALDVAPSGNQPPQGLAFLTPEPGSEVRDFWPTVVLSAPVDPDGDALRVDVVYGGRQDVLSGQAMERSVVVEDTDVLTILLDDDGLTRVSGPVIVRAVAVDEQGVVGAYAQVSFVYDPSHAPLEAPQLIAPMDDAVLLQADEVALVAVDLSGYRVGQQLVFTVDGPDGATTYAVASQPDQGIYTLLLPSDSLPDGEYLWRAQSVATVEDRTSASSAERRFTLASDDPAPEERDPGQPESSCSALGDSAPIGAMLAVWGLALLGRGRRDYFARTGSASGS